MNEAGSGGKIKYLSLSMHAGKPHEKALNSPSRQCCLDEIFFPPDAGRKAFWEKNLLPKYAGRGNFSSRTGLFISSSTIKNSLCTSILPLNCLSILK